MNIVQNFSISIISGLYTSLWGAYKDSPYEGFKLATFPRSITFSAFIFLVLNIVPSLESDLKTLYLSQIFFLIMGIERTISEVYKGFFRNEDQGKYKIPSRITFFGKHITNNGLRYWLGILISIGIVTILFLEINIERFNEFFLVALLTGLAGAFGGAYKDAPFEGFEYRKFLRTPMVTLATFPIFYHFSPVSLGYLIYMNFGIERFIVEFYKTYILRNRSGKFRPDLNRIQKYVDNRRIFFYAALVVVLGVIVLILNDIRCL